MQHGEGQTDKTYGPRTFKTPAFFEMGARVAYNIPLYKTYTLQLHFEGPGHTHVITLTVRAAAPL